MKTGSEVVNINCGVLGHIDSGKTSLCRVLTQVASTAALDKHPQSRERGITLDLGFSSFSLPPTDDDLMSTQVTLVDCPGHASLIRTVLGGARIMDLCLLIIDAQKGFQVQTAECLVIAEIVTSRLVVIVNKIDLIEDDQVDSFKSKMEKRIRNTIQKTSFPEGFPIVFVSASNKKGISDVTDAIGQLVRDRPARDSSGPLHVAYDHAFPIKGQGTIFTGTVLSGSLKRGQTVFFPYTLENAEVRSIEKFKQKVESVIQGDRIGICVPGITPADERGDIYANKDHLICENKIVFLVDRVRFYKPSIENGSKLHISLGHTHSMGTIYLFKHSGNSISCPSTEGQCLLDRLRGSVGAITEESITDSRYELVDDVSSIEPHELMYCLVLLAKPIKLLPGAAMIASKLDLDEDYPGCRLALFGVQIPFPENLLRTRVLRTKRKVAVIERAHGDELTYLVRGFLKKGVSDPDRFINCVIHHSTSGIPGKIVSTFGKSGLLRVEFSEALPEKSIGTTVHVDIEKPALAKIINNY